MRFPTEQETAKYFTNLLSDYRLQGIVEDYCKRNGVLVGRIIGKSRKEGLVQHRHNIAHIANKRGYSPKQIASALHRDRTTIRHYLEDYTPPTSTRASES